MIVCLFCFGFLQCIMCSTTCPHDTLQGNLEMTPKPQSLQRLFTNQHIYIKERILLGRCLENRNKKKPAVVHIVQMIQT